MFNEHRHHVNKQTITCALSTIQVENKTRNDETKIVPINIHIFRAATLYTCMNRYSEKKYGFFKIANTSDTS